MTITIVEFNVLKVMAEKDIDWSWMVLDGAGSYFSYTKYSRIWQRSEYRNKAG